MGKLMDMMARLGGHLVEMEVIEYALDGLESDSRARAEKHLRQCGMCRQAVKQTMDMQDGLGLLAAPVKVSDDLVGRIIAGVRQRQEQEARNENRLI